MSRYPLAFLLAISLHAFAVAQSPLIPDAKLTLISDAFELADGAAWDGAGQLFVPDVKAKTLLAFNVRKLDAKPKSIVEGLAISGTAFQRGTLYLSDNQNARIAVLESGNQVTTLCQFAGDERPNDLAVDAAGNVYVTITGKGTVKRVTPEGASSDIATGITTPNGIALSPSGNTLYVSSAKTGNVLAIDLTSDTKPADAAQPFAQLPQTEDGYRGDGMCVDRAGNVYVTAAKSVHVYAPNGTALGSITPPARPINAIIAGQDTRTLFLSTFGGLYSTPLNAYAVSPNRDPNDESDSPTNTRVGDGIGAQFNVVYHTDGPRELLMDLFTPTGSSSARPAIVVVHGGGWKNGDKTKFRPLALRLAERGYVVAAIEYRLAGEAAFPAGIRDCNAATLFLRQNAGQLGIDPMRIAAVGGSAGGHLVGLMAAANRNPELKHPTDRTGDASLAAAVVMAGPLEIASGSVAERSLEQPQQSNAVLWMRGDVQEQSERYRLADAYEQVDSSMPPTLFLCGSKDSPQRNQKTRDKMTALGIANAIVIHQDATHGHWNRPDWIAQVVDDIDQFLNAHLTKQQR